MNRTVAALAFAVAALCANCSEETVRSSPNDVLGDLLQPLDLPTSEVPPGDVGHIPCTNGDECSPFGLVCNLQEGFCTSVVCEAGEVTCSTPQAVQTCSADGLSYETENCPEGQGCAEGACAPVVCAPGTQRCQKGKQVLCHTSGTLEVELPCAEGRQCLEGECRPILHNVIMLFDTSASMGDCLDQDGQAYQECCPAGCPADWPVCETYEMPLSKLGHSKRVFKDFFESPSGSSAAGYALLSFPQTEAPGHSFCYSGYWYDQMSISGDDESHQVSPGGWFDQNMEQVVRVPIAPTWEHSNLDELTSWVDFSETQNIDPELRASGATPLGKSMFYAGEYIRLHVLVEGKPCTQDSDCGSRNYFCNDGACHDPLGHCRLTLLLVFTDGGESSFTSVEEFFNPVTQARRMKFGLDCQSDADCTGGAGCLGGYCQRFPQYGAPCVAEADCDPGSYCQEGVCLKPGFEWPQNAGVCAKNGGACLTNKPECPDMFETCKPVDGKVADAAKHLYGYDDKPIEVTTHVIDVSTTPESSKMVAAHGGGRHFSVNLAKTDVLLDVLFKMTDIKFGVECIAPETPL